MLLTIAVSFWSFKQIGNEDKLIGIWRIYSVVSNGTSIRCNVCPKVEFKKDQTAVLTYPNKNIETYTWTITESILSLKREKEENHAPYFRQNEYKMNLETRPEHVKLRLSDNNNQRYNLTKMKVEEKSK